jgi:acyl carrier protein
MKSLTIEERVKFALVDTLQVDWAHLMPQTLLVDDLAMDSLDRAQLAINLEDSLTDERPIDEEMAERWTTVQDVVDSMEAMVAKQGLKLVQKGGEE